MAKAKKKPKTVKYVAPKLEPVPHKYNAGDKLVTALQVNGVYEGCPVEVVEVQNAGRIYKIKFLSSKLVGTYGRVPEIALKTH